MAKEEILVVDDEAPIRTALRAAFAREQMHVTEAADGSAALEMLKNRRFSLVILDVMMENIGGYEVLQRMRASGDMTPVMMLSGKSDEMDQVLGLGYGADSYLTKPFRASVLIQTAKALIRRSQIYTKAAPQEIRCGPFRIDLYRMECFKGTEQLAFTGRELNMFRLFMDNPGRVFTKEQLYERIWGEAIVDDNTVTVYVKRIRQKIEDDPRNPRYLQTVRGIGYRFEA